MQNENLERKINEFAEGNEKAFDYIYEHTYKAVYFSILYLVKNKSEAEDLLQETYLRGLRSLSSYRRGTNFIGWLCTIGKNLAYNLLDKRKRELLTDFSEDFKFGVQETETPFVFDLAKTILSEEEFEILMLCQVAGYKRREVAKMLGIPIGTVTWKNNEALKKLKKELEKEDGI